MGLFEFGVMESAEKTPGVLARGGNWKTRGALGTEGKGF